MDEVLDLLGSGQVRSVRCTAGWYSAVVAVAALVQQCVEHFPFKLPSAPAPITQSRTLTGCAVGGVTLAVNGRIGRRVSCVLDEAGLNLEVLDMEGEEEEEDLELEEAEEDEVAEGSG